MIDCKPDCGANERGGAKFRRPIFNASEAALLGGLSEAAPFALGRGYPTAQRTQGVVLRRRVWFGHRTVDTRRGAQSPREARAEN